MSVSFSDVFPGADPVDIRSEVGVPDADLPRFLRKLALTLEPDPTMVAWLESLDWDSVARSMIDRKSVDQ